MDCKEFERRLDARLDGVSSGELDPAARSHADACLRCRELEVLLRPEELTDGGAVPVDVVAGVLERTTGPSCGAALEAIAASLEGTLDSSASARLEGHLGRCPRCGAIARVAASLAGELPELAETDPGPGFVDAVMRRTLPFSSRLRRRWVPWLDRIRGFALRPRFPVESAYAGALLAVAALALAGIPLGDAAEACVRMASAAGRSVETVRDGSRELAPAVAAPYRELEQRFDDALAGGAERAGAAQRAIRSWTKGILGEFERVRGTSDAPDASPLPESGERRPSRDEANDRTKESER